MVAAMSTQRASIQQPTHVVALLAMSLHCVTDVFCCR